MLIDACNPNNQIRPRTKYNTFTSYFLRKNKYRF